MTINLSDNSPRVSYSVAAGVTQTSFTVSFEFFDNDDLNVYVDGVLKTLTTDYSVSGGDGSTGTITMSVTGASGGSTVVITRDIDLDRTTDFPSSGPFNIASLNTELDRFVAIAADLKDQSDRSLQLTDYDAAVSLVLPDVNTRKGKTLAFNETTGAVEAGPSTSDVQTVSATAADIATLADIEDGTDATDAIQTVAGISSNVTTVAGVSANVTTVAGISANVTTVANDESDIGTVAANIADINTAATNITEIQNASTNAATATTKAAEAATSASNASTSETNAATSATTATTKAGEASTSATNAATSETNAGNSATAAASSASAAATSETNAANSAAAAAAAFDNFDDTYLGSKTSDPTVDNDGNALVSGALYFNSTANEMRVYDGANWIAASSAGTASLILYEYTATSGQTTFSGADDNSASLSYSVGNIQVVMNGIVLDPSDFTATSGTSVVLASGAATGDLVNIYAFKSFTVADTVSASAGGTFAGNVVMTSGLTVDNDGSTVLTVDRATSDGAIIDLQKSGSSVGVIGTRAGFVRIGTGDTGLEFHSGDNTIYSANMSTNGLLDGALNLGSGSYRFKDLYLSGGVYLGGTGSANKLDDYEEGNWTPTYLRGGTATYVINSGRYTKVGNLVHLQCHLDIDSLGTASGDAEVIGLPFTSANDSVQYASISSIHGSGWSVAADNLNGLVIPNSTKVFLYRNTGSSSIVKLNHGNIGVGNLLFNVTYKTTA